MVPKEEVTFQSAQIFTDRMGRQKSQVSAAGISLVLWRKCLQRLAFRQPLPERKCAFGIRQAQDTEQQVTTVGKPNGSDYFGQEEK